MRFPPNTHAYTNAFHNLLPENLIQFTSFWKHEQIHAAITAGLNFRSVGQQIRISSDFTRAIAVDMPHGLTDHIAPGYLLIPGPWSLAQNVVFGICNNGWGPKPVAGNPQDGFYALLIGRDLCHLFKQINRKCRVVQLIPNNRIHSLLDHFTVTEVRFIFGHAYQNKIEFVCQLNQFWIYPWKNETNII